MRVQWRAFGWRIWQHAEHTHEGGAATPLLQLGARHAYREGLSVCQSF